MTGASVADEQRGTEVARAAAGDEVAFARMVATHHAYLRRVAMVICRDADAAEDAAQQAWQICWRKLATLRDPRRVRPSCRPVDAHATAGPPGRPELRRHGFEQSTGLIVQFGGSPARGSFTNETWLYDLAANAWREWSP